MGPDREVFPHPICCQHLPRPPPSFYPWWAPPFLPAGCRKQHAGTRNLGRPLGHRTPTQVSLKRVVG